MGDTNIKYFGRWDFSSSSQYVSYWGGAYIRVNFTGTTVKIKLGNTSNFYARIDNGPWVSYTGVTGTVNLTGSPLTNGTHTLSVAQGKDYDYVFLDTGATTSAPSTSDILIEYIGDSITTGYTDTQADVSDYAWVCSENLGCEHTQIAFPGIALVNGGFVSGFIRLLLQDKSALQAYFNDAVKIRGTPKIIFSARFFFQTPKNYF